MKTPARLLLLCFSLLLTLARPGLAQDAKTQPLPEGFRRVEFKVDGVAREALIYVPTAAKEKPAPVVFVFHGHGGNSRNAMRSFPMNKEWPEAISVYMQGLNTPGRLTDPEGLKPGWQHSLGNQGDRDLKFFDAVLARLKQDFNVDGKRIYSTGHSNGGAFTYLLWAARGDVFAAVAPCAAVAVQLNDKLKPKPALHIAGEKDPLVKFEWQQATMNAVRQLNGCSARNNLPLRAQEPAKAWPCGSLTLRQRPTRAHIHLHSTPLHYTRLRRIFGVCEWIFQRLQQM
ncbi:MAG: prolyl oligopeptidase family serine peptidase [Verrucomicrobia bacterium]|nr:prolyl oligopeptidase family serine peptidase [Verrucomicrobiota bacterium]